MDAKETIEIDDTRNNSELLHLSAAPNDTIVSVATQHAQELPNQKYITWLDRGKTESDSFTFAELDRQARTLAVQLRSIAQSYRPYHDRPVYPAALIVTQPGLDFVKAFFACLYAGIVAVPTHPLKRGESSQRLNMLLNDSHACMVLTDDKSYSQITEFPDIVKQTSIVRLNSLSLGLYDDWQFPEISENSPAFYQYTSGSTGRPKGVIVTHGNLMSNERAISDAMQTSRDTVVVGWLPLFHDMGLIGNLLQPFYLGVSCYLMSPLAFIASPIRWLQAISKYQATASGGPNFGYELCVTRTTAEQRAGLDLSHWQVAFNGSEPVRAATMDRFSRTFAASGFNRSAFFPCYGMAESTLFITGSSPERPYTVLTVDKHHLELGKVHPVCTINTSSKTELPAEEGFNKGQTLQLVSSGKPYQGCEVKIVDPESLVELDEQHVGEIWTCSASVAKGYKNKQQLTQHAFKARISQSEDNKQYLRTGDLGFLYKGELFVTGRHKDLIIINGRNHYPQDLEQTAIQAHELLSSCRAAAFSVDSGTQERPVIILSLSKNLVDDQRINDSRTAIHEAITREHNLNLHDLVFITSRLPETSSGKLQRSRCKQMYLAGDFASNAEDTQ